ncbi:MAG: lipase [Pirellulaceae bacterium]|nr:MAG: lipase [Pirellulaceae bacterium]GIW95827.1 MAG: lipase [Pirellulaceae bacterium]
MPHRDQHQPGSRNTPSWELTPSSTGPQSRPEWVLLVHGLASHRVLLAPLARHLRRAGFRAVTWGYKSLWQPIHQSADQLRDYLKTLADRDDVPRIHLVGHSMGNLLIRYALTQLPTEKFQRFVMLAPPNQGSHVARHVRRFVEKWLPPIGQLSDEPGSWVRRLADVPPPIEVGIIAAEFDLLVPPDSLRLNRPVQMIVIRTIHSGLLVSRQAARATSAFLQTGAFPEEFHRKMVGPIE